MTEPIETNSISSLDDKTWICRKCGVEESQIDYCRANGNTSNITKEMLENEQRLADILGIKTK